MANFDAALKVTLREEGWWSNDPSDPGGETWCGISRNHWPTWIGWAFIDEFRKIGPIWVMEAKESDALAAAVHGFYAQSFWNPQYEEISDQAVATKLFDLAVNDGSTEAHRILQLALHDLGFTGVQVDGVLGPGTMRALQSALGAQNDGVLKHMKHRAAFRYATLALNDPTKAKFLKGWLLRNELVP